ncbi:nose resistant to fluoxetine protein 6-like isoform X2 [Mytilus californianus]|uniref:nose resistant to fluoxetine protein 6-like isoform X2 n=1 Tax=Mytilus californianus TaxID=6549 RepID=UPI002246E420|nr:nose resistant to fluoxetine protein 6-like isoform X2 [Mytilus californianus]
MMKMSLTLMTYITVHVLLVSGFDNYQEILIRVNQLPEIVNLFKTSPNTIGNAVKILDQSFDFSTAIETDGLSDSDLVKSNVTISPPVVPVLSNLCMNQTEAVFKALLEGQNWAERMIDAAAKPPADLLGGDITWLGDYDECLAIHSNLTENMEIAPFDGEYCLVGIPIPVKTIPNPLVAGQYMLRLGVCVPDGCSETDTLILINTVLSKIPNNTMLAASVQCQNPDREFDTRATVVIVIVSLFITVMVIGTVYDVLYIQWPKSKVQTMAGLLNGEVTENYQYKITAEEDTPLIRDKTTLEYKPGLLGKLLLSFSIYTNGAKILSTDQSAGSLNAVNGIRFISMSWVILGHTYGIFTSISDNMLPFTILMFKRWSFGAILNALVSVDTFFTLSGLLLTYLIMKELKRKDGKINWFMFYFHRFWRLTPPYMLVLMVYVSLFPYIGSGPLWKKDGMEVNYCKDAWYYNFLYINNFVNLKDTGSQCMAWTWYLANDMQFFVISPLIIIPLFFSKAIGGIVMFVFLLGSWITTGVISKTYNMKPTLVAGGDFFPYFDYYYIKPYCRIGPYLMGMFTGYVLYRTNCKCRINRYVNLFVWIVAAGLAIIILYGLYDEMNGHPMSVDVAALYNTVHRTLWGACVCWVIFACATGNGGFVNTILSWKAFVPLSRLTYCAYLIHPIIMYYFSNVQRKFLHFSDLTVMYLFLPNMCLSYAAAFIASLAFESPMMGLEKVIFRRGEKKD